MRTTVDEVADEDKQCLARRPCLQVRVDLVEQLLEQIEPAMNVADNICAMATDPRW
jgi:hypothetical protein